MSEAYRMGNNQPTSFADLQCKMYGSCQADRRQKIHQVKVMTNLVLSSCPWDWTTHPSDNAGTVFTNLVSKNCVRDFGGCHSYRLDNDIYDFDNLGKRSKFINPGGGADETCCLLLQSVRGRVQLESLTLHRRTARVG